jgi:hypothetical protein
VSKKTTLSDGPINGADSITVELIARRQSSPGPSRMASAANNHNTGPLQRSGKHRHAAIRGGIHDAGSTQGEEASLTSCACRWICRCIPDPS